MIFDVLTEAPLYHALGPRIRAGLDWLARRDPALPVGRHEIAGDDVFALVQQYDTVDPRERQFESHRNYLDIQFIAAGVETLYYAPVRELTVTTPYNPEKDFSLHADPAVATPLRARAGMFALFSPHDAHKPGCRDGDVSQVSKIVVKVRVAG